MNELIYLDPFIFMSRLENEMSQANHLEARLFVDPVDEIIIDTSDNYNELKSMVDFILLRFINQYPNCFTKKEKMYRYGNCGGVNRVSMFAVGRIVNNITKELRQDLKSSLRSRDTEEMFKIMMSNKFRRDVCEFIFSELSG